jgi:hypothetical protein
VPIEGELIVRLDHDGRHLRRVTVRLTRPRLAARVLAGRSATDAAATVPLLFSICRGAQGAAAASALTAAGATGLPENAGRRELDVMLESLQDTMRNLLIDGPGAMGAVPCAAPVAATRTEIAAFLRMADASTVRALGMRLSGIAADAIFGMRVADWRDLSDVDAFLAWCADGGTVVAAMLGQLFAGEPTLGRSAIPLMPPARADALLGILVPAMRADAAFASTPTWAGSPVETGALARMRSDPLVAAVEGRFGNAVGTRIVARLAELAVLIQELTGSGVRPEAPPRIQGISLGDGEGLAAVQTARGLLLHRARLADDRVVDYQIVAPTEWNFHPDGALPLGLAGLEVDDQPRLLRAVQLAVHALDPCVGFRIEVGHA